MIKITLSIITFYLGHWISLPLWKWDWYWLYPVYAKLMTWSSDLDVYGIIWKSPEDEEFKEYEKFVESHNDEPKCYKPL